MLEKLHSVSVKHEHFRAMGELKLKIKSQFPPSELVNLHGDR